MITMDPFEEVVALCIQELGYWVRPRMTLTLNRDEQKAARHGNSRYEIDIVALRRSPEIRVRHDRVAKLGPPNRAHVLIIECKAWGEGGGVRANSFLQHVGPDIMEPRSDLTGEPEQPAHTNYFKIFNHPEAAAVIQENLGNVLVQNGLLHETDLGTTKFLPCLACFQFLNQHHEELIRNHFNTAGWLSIGPQELRSVLQNIAVQNRRDSPEAYVARLLNAAGN